MNHCLLCASTAFTVVLPHGECSVIGKCSQCGFVQVFPHLSVRACRAQYTDDWDNFAPYLSQIPAHRAYFNTLLRFLGKKMSLVGKQMLDIGCAIGLFVEEARRIGIQAEGVDISASAVSYGKKQHLPLSTDTGISWQKKKRYTNRYTVITALSVIEHEADPKTMMAAVFRMLRPGGFVVISTPNFDSFFRKSMGKRWIGYKHPEHLWFFTPVTITRLLQDAGFVDCIVRRDFQRSYSVSYALHRLGDYLPAFRSFLYHVASFFGSLQVPIMINPWGDMLIIARKS